MKIGKNAEFKNYLLDFLHLADFNVTGLNDRIEEEPIPAEVQKILMNDENVPEEIKQKLTGQSTIKRQIIGFEHTVENDRGKETYELQTEQQSAGTKRVMGIEAAIYEAVNNDAILLIDKLEPSLHPDLMEYILQEYLLKESQSQLLITTHFPGLLDTIDNLIRKDNVWFVEKSKNGSTDCIRLLNSTV